MYARSTFHACMMHLCAYDALLLGNKKGRLHSSLEVVGSSPKDFAVIASQRLTNVRFGCQCDRGCLMVRSEVEKSKHSRVDDYIVTKSLE
ncbi:hypothetical protein L2E82_38020 [Cichorium intybus]|uniref:Uncharacterized protein n=1 Tax=Cichorium intybus TaxID=13427 RepID=A0ACB9AEW1_CICIN|nr:hypothetical protein L2E82_38020 [Cichorium intybus]